MTVFAEQGYFINPDELNLSRYTDLTLSADGSVLFATHLYDGGIRAFQVSNSGLSQIDFASHAANPVAGADPNLAIFNDRLLSGGAAGFSRARLISSSMYCSIAVNDMRPPPIQWFHLI